MELGRQHLEVVARLRPGVVQRLGVGAEGVLGPRHSLLLNVESEDGVTSARLIVHVGRGSGPSQTMLRSCLLQRPFIVNQSIYFDTRVNR